MGLFSRSKKEVEKIEIIERMDKSLGCGFDIKNLDIGVEPIFLKENMHCGHIGIFIEDKDIRRDFATPNMYRNISALIIDQSSNPGKFARLAEICLEGARNKKSVTIDPRQNPITLDMINDDEPSLYLCTPEDAIIALDQIRLALIKQASTGRLLNKKFVIVVNEGTIETYTVLATLFDKCGGLGTEIVISDGLLSDFEKKVGSLLSTVYKDNTYTKLISVPAFTDVNSNIRYTVFRGSDTFVAVDDMDWDKIEKLLRAATKIGVEVK